MYFDVFFFFPPDLSYNIALCYYRMKQYALALKHIAEIIERGIREHPGNYLEIYNLAFLIGYLFNI